MKNLKNLIKESFAFYGSSENQKSAIRTIESWLKRINMKIIGASQFGEHGTVSLDLTKKYSGEIYVGENGFGDSKADRSFKGGYGRFGGSVEVNGIPIPNEKSFNEFKKAILESLVIQNEYKKMKSLSLIQILETYYHGRRGKIIFDEDKPMFFAKDKETADWYSDARGKGESNILETDLDIKKPFKLYSKKDAFKFIEIIKRAGFDIVIDYKKVGWDIPQKYTQPVRDHSPYDGENLIDWIYVPKVKDQLKKEGYDGILAYDILGNKEIEIAIPFFKRQIKNL